MDASDAFALLTRAFEFDRVERWMYPGDFEYAEHFPQFLRAFGGMALEEGTAWTLPDRSAVALWLPPGVGPDGEAIVELLRQTVRTSVHRELFEVLQQMGTAHPVEPHWYLPWLGVDPAAQGRGRGSALLAACLARVDGDGMPAYLETPNPRTIGFYERHGFEMVGQTSSPSCPAMTFMSRPAKR